MAARTAAQEEARGMNGLADGARAREGRVTLRRGLHSS